MLTRQGFLRLGGTAALALAAKDFRVGIPTAQAAAVETLRQAASRAGILNGANSDAPVAANPAYRRLFVQQCDLFAPNMSWHRISPRRGIYDFGFLEPDIRFTTEHGLRLTGYHLVWHLPAPQWFSDLDHPDDARHAITAYISVLGMRFGSATYSWNVVNEAINTAEGRPDGLRHTPFLKLLGPDYIAYMFQVARNVDRHVLRVYNEYAVELASPAQEAKRTALLRLLDRLQRAGAPIQAIGLQSHLKVQTFEAFDPKVYRAFLKEIAGRNLKILITELDVFDREAGSVASQDRSVAGVYDRFLSVALDETAVVAVVTWGLSNPYSFLNQPQYPQFLRADHSPARPLPFDTAFQPTPAFTAIFNAFNAAPRR